MKALGEALSGLSEAFREFALMLSLAGAVTKREVRRLARDRARETRRPPIIHNGRKARP